MGLRETGIVLLGSGSKSIKDFLLCQQKTKKCG